MDYDDKQSIGTVGDDYNQKINSLKTIWDITDQPTGQLEQTIKTMVAMQQKHDNIPSNNSTKTDNYVQESSSVNKSTTNPNVSSTTNDDTNNKNPPSTQGSSSTINQPPAYSATTVQNKNEQKNICTVKPTQQVPPNIQDQVDVTGYQTFAPPLPPPMSQQQQQHILSQSQVNPLHQQQHTYTFYDNILPPPTQQQPPPQQQQQFNRVSYSFLISSF